MTEKVWVVAKDGLVGSEMMKYLDEREVDHVGSTRQEADVTHPDSLKAYFEKHSPNLIINCSANVNVDAAEGVERDLAYDVNVTGPANLAKLAKERATRLLHISTDYVFDGDNDTDYVETDAVNPVNHYGITKLEGEQKLLEIYPEALSLRTASIFGAGKPGLVTGIIKMLESQEEAKGIVDQISTPTYSKHIVRALWDVRNEKGIFHFVNKGFASRFDLVEEVKNLANKLGHPIKCERIKGMPSVEFGRAAVRPKRSVLSTEKIERILKWPIRTWQEALREYLAEIRF